MNAHEAAVADLRRCERNRAIQYEEGDKRVVLLAALCFLSWQDTGQYPTFLAGGLTPERIAEAIDTVTGWPVPSEVDR